MSTSKRGSVQVAKAGFGGAFVLAAATALVACGADVGDGTREAEATVVPASAIQHLVVIVQENHSFDNYFGTYCTAAPGSDPSCNTGPGCCEAAPKTDPGSGTSQWVLTDTINSTFDPDETQACQNVEMNGGKMDQYVSASCGHYMNFSFAPASLVQQYRTWAGQYAMGDRYFQSVSGASSANDMYLAAARFMFLDDAYEPKALGHGCQTNTSLTSFASTSLGDLLNAKGVSWSFYLEGYAAMKSSLLCPAPPSDCAAAVPTYPCVYDPSDVGQAYYPTTADDPAHFRDLAQLSTDLSKGTLPSVVFIRGLGYHSEHPSLGITVSAGVQFVTGLVNQVEKSKLASSTLVLLTYDESGGWYDHVAPPPASAVDGQPYGARIPMLAIGPFARKNWVSHVPMEHASIVKFVEWNWLGGTGQLGARDAAANNLGSVLDPTTTGTTVPSN
jgi:phospholipase C